MKTFKTKTVKTQVVKDVTCDICAKSMMGVQGIVHGLQQWMCGQYGSPLLGDDTEYEFDVCEACLMEWFKKFKTLRITET